MSWHGVGLRVGRLALGTWFFFSVFLVCHVFHDLLFHFWRAASVWGSTM